MANYHPTEAQLRALEAMEKGDGRVLLGGQRSGRRYATELAIIAQAATPEDAQLAIEDLNTKGVACLTRRGERVEPKGNRRFTIVRFDEERQS